MQRQKCTKAKQHFKGALALILESYSSNLLLKDKLVIHRGTVHTYTWSGMKGPSVQQSCLIPVPLSVWSFMSGGGVFLFFLDFIWFHMEKRPLFCVCRGGRRNDCTRSSYCTRSNLHDCCLPMYAEQRVTAHQPVTCSTMTTQVYASVSQMLCLCYLWYISSIV